MHAAPTPVSQPEAHAQPLRSVVPARAHFDASTSTHTASATASNASCVTRIAAMTRDQLAVELQLKQDEKVALMEKYIQCLEGQSDPGTDKAQLKRQRARVQSHITAIKDEIRHRAAASQLRSLRQPPEEASTSTAGCSPRPLRSTSREDSVVLAPDSSPLLRPDVPTLTAAHARETRSPPPLPHREGTPEPAGLTRSNQTRTKVRETTIGATAPPHAPPPFPPPPISRTPSASPPPRTAKKRRIANDHPKAPAPPAPPLPSAPRRSRFRPAPTEAPILLSRPVAAWPARPPLPPKPGRDPPHVRALSPRPRSAIPPEPARNTSVAAPRPERPKHPNPPEPARNTSVSAPRPERPKRAQPDPVDIEGYNFFDGLEQDALDALINESQLDHVPHADPAIACPPAPAPAPAPARTTTAPSIPCNVESGFGEDCLVKGAAVQTSTSKNQCGRPEEYVRSMQPALAVEVSWVLRNIFHLSNFRSHQLEAIDATLRGHDVFCLMPTGGGKSLCYQLPALVSAGRTRGVTVVISPLLSLINDQVSHLLRLGIPAFNITGDMTAAARRTVFGSLKHPTQLEARGQLLYVTPEFANKSEAARELFAQLYSQARLARFVVDEAHCVSQWGHDFRPDYKHLGRLRSEYPNVPIMAMTATAPPRVQMDILTVLKVTNAVKFVSSFNRPNLQYEVRRKGKYVLKDMADFIKAHHDDQCGIIYCLSQRACEEVAEKLFKEHNLHARHYHAGMSKNDRNMFQSAWQAGEFKIMVATIAFGMGIDKGDVRFVLHHSLPQSVEGFYQETGRAGRDGQVSDCILYFAPRDITVLRKMISKAKGGDRCTKSQQLENLDRMVQYCFDSYNCRRQQLLKYFDEDFDPKDCRQTCDNCRRDTGELEEKDMTEDATRIIEMIPSLTGNVTLQHCIDVYRGAQSKVIRERGHHLALHAGKGKSIPRNVLERLFYAMHSHKGLKEYTKINEAGYSAAYIEPGVAAPAIKSRRIKITVTMPKGKAGATAKAGNGRKLPLATSVVPAVLSPDTQAEPVERPRRCLRLSRQTRSVRAGTSEAARSDDVGPSPDDDSSYGGPQFVSKVDDRRGALALIRAHRAGAAVRASDVTSPAGMPTSAAAAPKGAGQARRCLQLNANGVQIEDEEADRISSDEDIDIPLAQEVAHPVLDEIDVSDDEEEPDDADDSDIYHRCLSQLQAVRSNAIRVERCSADAFLPDSIIQAIAANPPETRGRLEEMVGSKKIDPLFQKYRLDVLRICREYADEVDEDWRAQTQAIRATLRPPASPPMASRCEAVTSRSSAHIFTPQRLPDLTGFAAPSASSRSSRRDTCSSNRSTAQLGSPSPSHSSARDTSRFFDKTNRVTRTLAQDRSDRRSSCILSPSPASTASAWLQGGEASIRARPAQARLSKS